MKNRSEMGQAGKPLSGCSQNSAGRGQILSVLQVNSRSIDQKSDEICTVRADLQPIPFKSDRLLAIRLSQQAGKSLVIPRKRESVYIEALDLRLAESQFILSLSKGGDVE